MPVSMKAADYLTRDYLHRTRGIEALEFHGVEGRCLNAPDYYDLRDSFERVFFNLAEGIDWRRVFIAASGHAFALQNAGLRAWDDCLVDAYMAIPLADDMACALTVGETFTDWGSHVVTVHKNDKKVSAG